MSDKKSGGILGALGKAAVAVGLADETPESEAHPPPPPPPRGFTPPAAPAQPTKIEWHTAPTPPPAAADPEMLSKLQKRLENSCPPVYLAFHEQCENLKRFIPDEATRIPAAIAASHASTDDILRALDQLGAVMDGARKDFLNTWEQNRARKQTDAEASIKATDEQIATCEAQAKALQETLASLRTKRAADAAAMGTDVAKLETIRASFEAAWTQVAGDLTTQKNRIASMPKV